MKHILKGELTRSVKIKRSEFIAHLFCVESAEEVKRRVREVVREHKNASHNCWAYIVGADGEVCHCSDDGEPSGSAGKPMLGALSSRDLTNACVVVSRYFGGVKLGIPGLIEAYSAVVGDAVDEVGIEPLIHKVTYFLEMCYSKLDSLSHKLSSLGLELSELVYSQSVQGKVVVPESVEDEFLAVLAEMRVESS